ncbi:ABC transporter permease [Faecalimicrobium sp. JNUCC 81]
MLKLIQIEIFKLRRKKLIWLMPLSAIIMPFFALLYFNYFGEKGVDPLEFYRWSALSFTIVIILPFILGILSTMLMHDENQYDMLKQLWIVPISKMGYFFSKFFVVLVYSICFMLITFVASIMFSVLSGYVIFEWGSVLYLLKKCLGAGFFTAFAMLPILAIASSQKGYIFPVCITLVYAFSAFFIMPVNMYLHPLTSMAVILDVPGIVFTQSINVLLAFLCICVWDITFVLLANVALKRSEV